jgi:hypothetical protein
MKKMNLISVLGFTILFVVLSCSKQEQSLKPQKSFSEITPNDSIINLITNENDQDDEDNNMILYHYGKAFLDVAENQSLMNDVYSILRDCDSAIKEVTINELFNQNSQIEGIMENNLGETWWNSQMHHNGQNYDISLMYFNDSTANENMEPIIAIGTGFNENDENLQNHTPCWILSNNQWTEWGVDEDFCKQTQHPVIILTTYSHNCDTVSASISNKNDGSGGLNFNSSIFRNKQIKPTLKVLSDYSIIIDQIKINYRYDNCHYSKVKMNYKVFTSTRSFSRNQHYIRDMSKNWIGDVQYNLGILLYSDYFENLYHDVFHSGTTYLLVGATYEDDWYASPKPVPVGNYTIMCQMRYTHEFYQRILMVFDETNLYYADWNNGFAMYGVPNWQNVTLYWKGFVKITK